MGDNSGVELGEWFREKRGGLRDFLSMAMPLPYLCREYYTGVRVYSWRIMVGGVYIIRVIEW